MYTFDGAILYIVKWYLRKKSRWMVALCSKIIGMLAICQWQTVWKSFYSTESDHSSHEKSIFATKFLHILGTWLCKDEWKKKIENSLLDCK